MLHISSPGTSLGLFEVARLALDEVRGRVFIYGPFKWNHQPTTESNRAFDEKLKNMSDTGHTSHTHTLHTDHHRKAAFDVSTMIGMTHRAYVQIHLRINSTSDYNLLLMQKQPKESTHQSIVRIESHIFTVSLFLLLLLSLRS